MACLAAVRAILVWELERVAPHGNATVTKLS